MSTSTWDIVLNKSGSSGAQLLRQLYASGNGKVLSDFVEHQPKLVSRWVSTPWHRRERLPENEFRRLVGNHADLGRQLGLSEEEVRRILDSILFELVQLSAPDGEAVSPRAVELLERNLAQGVISSDPPSSTSQPPKPQI